MTLALTLCFGIVMYVGGFGIIDEMYNVRDIEDHIKAMEPAQRSAHAWLTGTVDVIYPFAYGAFFIGIAIRYFGRFGPLLALPSLLVIPADLTEGYAQVMLLTGHEQFMDLKVMATPIKLVLFLTGLAITLVGLGLALKGRRNTSS